MADEEKREKVELAPREHKIKVWVWSGKEERKKNKRIGLGFDP
jgi:hypothetical protein